MSGEFPHSPVGNKKQKMKNIYDDQQYSEIERKVFDENKKKVCKYHSDAMCSTNSVIMTSLLCYVPECLSIVIAEYMDNLITSVLLQDFDTFWNLDRKMTCCSVCEALAFAFIHTNDTAAPDRLCSNCGWFSISFQKNDYIDIRYYHVADKMEKDDVYTEYSSIYNYMKNIDKMWKLAWDNKNSRKLL